MHVTTYMSLGNFHVQQTTEHGVIIPGEEAYARTRPHQSFIHVMRTLCRHKGWETYDSPSVFGDYDYLCGGAIVQEIAPNGTRLLMGQFNLAPGQVLEIKMQRKWIYRWAASTN